MSDIINQKIAELEEVLKQDLGDIEMKVSTEGPTLATLMRDGAKVLKQEVDGWGNGETGCGLSAGYLAARARKLLGE